MKKILYFLLAGIILTAIIWSCEENAVEQKSQVASKGGPIKLTQRENGTCLDTTCCKLLYTQTTRTIKVPGYEPCEAMVTFDLYSCTNCNGIFSRLVFNNISVALKIDSCTALKNRWDSLHNATNYSQENSEMDAYYKKAIDSVQKATILGYFNNNDIYHLKDSFPCSGQLFFASEYYSAMCYVWCVTDYPYATPPYTSLTKLLCGDICCVRSTTWCWNGSYVQSNIVGTHEYGSTCGDSFSGCPGSGRTVGTSCDSHPCEE